MLRRIALPALVLAISASTAVSQTPQIPAPRPAPQTPPYPQASPQQNPASMSPADSQQMQQGRQFALQRNTTLLNGITLTADQRGRVDSILVRYQPDFPAGSPENATDSMLVQRWSILLPRLDNEVRMVLTADQQRTWDRNVDQLRNRRPGIGDR